MVLLALWSVLVSGLYNSTLSYDECKESNWLPKHACSGPKLMHDIGEKTCPSHKKFDGKHCK